MYNNIMENNLNNQNEEKNISTNEENVSVDNSQNELQIENNIENKNTENMVSEAVNISSDEKDSLNENIESENKNEEDLENVNNEDVSNNEIKEEKTDTSNSNETNISEIEEDDEDFIEDLDAKPNFVEKIRTFLKSRKDYCITFSIVLALFFVHLVFNGAFFGKNVVLVSDSYEQVYAFFEHFYNVFSGKATLFYSNFYRKGFEMFSTLQYMFSNPFYLIVFLGGRRFIAQMFTVAMFAMLVFSAFTFMWFTKKYIKNIETKTRIFFAILYTFSAFINFNYSFITWFIYPSLILILIDRFINFTKTGKVGSFIAVFVWYIVSCYSVGISTAIMLFIIFTVYILMTQEKDKKKSQLTGLFVVFGVSALVSMALLFPSIIDVLNTGRGNSFIANLFSKERELSLHKYGFVFDDAGVLILSVIYFIKCDKKDKLNRFLLALVCLVFAPVVFNSIMKIFCLSKYQGFPARFYFLNEVALFIPALMLVEKKLIKPIECKTESMSKLIFGLILSFLGLTLLILEFVNYESIGQIVKTPTYPGTSITVINFFFLAMFVVLIGFAIFFNYRKILSAYLVKVSFVIVMVISLSLNILTFTGYARNTLYANKKEITKLIKDSNINGNFKVFNSEICSNHSNWSVGDVKKVSAFSSLVSSDMIDNYFSLGYNASIAVATDFTGTIISDSLMGIKYYVTDHEEVRPYLSLIEKSENYYLYENILAGTGAYAFDKDFRFEDTIDFYKHFEKLQNYFEITGDLFSEANVTITDDVEYEDVTRVGEDTKQKVTFTAEKDGILYINAYLAFDEYDEKEEIKNHAISNVSDKYLQDLKYLKDGETYTFYIQKYIDKVDISELKFKFMDYSIAEQICNKLKEISQQFTYNKDGYTIELTAEGEKNIFVFNPKLDGMKYNIDGKVAQSRTLLHNMVYFETVGTEIKITAEYKYPYLMTWITFAVICIVLAVILYVLHHFKLFRKLESVIYYSMLGVVAVLVLFAYGFGTIVSIINFF